MNFLYRKLRGRIIEMYGSQEAFARKLGVSTTTLSKKMTGGVQFSQRDIVLWCDLLDLDLSDAARYFFE